MEHRTGLENTAMLVVKSQPARANKELAYIKRIFSWAYEYEKIKTNPTLGVKKLTIKAPAALR